MNILKLKKTVWLAICSTVLLVGLTGCGGNSAEALTKAMSAAMEGCNEGGTAKLEVVAKTWDKGVVFTCEWVVSEDNDILNN